MTTSAVTQTAPELDKATPEIDKLQAHLRLAEEQAQAASASALGACSFTFLLRLSPAVFAQSPGISLAALAARVAALDSRP